MIQRIALATAGIATAALLTACTAPETSETEETPQSAAASEPESAPVESEQPDVQTTQGELLPDFPAAIEQFPDSEVVSSSIGSEAGGAAQEDAAPPEDAETPAEDAEAAQPDEGQVGAALVMRTDQSEQDVLDFYVESLEGHGFTAVGEADSRDDVTTQAFHAEEDNQTVSVSIGPDPADDSTRLITVGGVVSR